MQLESQRAFYEEKIYNVEKLAIEDGEKAQKKISMLQDELKETQKENASLKQTLDALVKDKSVVDKKYETLNVKMNKLESQLNEERQMNKCLTDNQVFYKSKLSELEDNMKKNDETKNNVSFYSFFEDIW